MTIAITEKVRQKMGGTDFRVLEVTGMSIAKSYILSKSVTGLRWIEWATFSPTICVTSAGSTNFPTITLLTAPCNRITLSCVGASGACGTLQLWGEG